MQYSRFERGVHQPLRSRVKICCCKSITAGQSRDVPILNNAAELITRHSELLELMRLTLCGYVESYKSNLIAYCLDRPIHKTPRASTRLLILPYNIKLIPTIIIISCSRCKTSRDTVVYHLSIIIKMYTVVNIAVIIRRV